MLASLISVIVNRWHQIVSSGTALSLSPDDTRERVERLAKQTVSLLDEEHSQRQPAVDALARQLLALRLPPQAIGQLQEALLQEIAQSQSHRDALPAARRLVGDLTASLLRHQERQLPEGEGETTRRLRLLQAALETSISAVAVWALDGVIAYVNPAFLAVWGYDHPADLLGRQASDLWADDRRFSAVSTSVTEAGGWIGKIRAIRCDGNQFTVMLAACLAEADETGPALVAACAVDMTYREQLSAMLWRRVDRLKALQRVDRSILAATEPEEIAQAALEHIEDLIPCRRASVTLFEPGADRAKFLAAVPRNDYAVEMEHGLSLAGFEKALESLQQGQIHLIDDLCELPIPDATRQLLHRRQAHALVVLPLRREEGLIGGLNLAFSDPDELTERHLSIAQEVADSLAVAIRHAQLNQAIAQHHEQLQDLTARLAQANEAERRRLARELHDQIGQKLTALGINLNVVKAKLQSQQKPDVVPRLDDSLQLLKETTERVRRVMADLRPPMLDDYGLLPTLRWCCKQLKSRIDVETVVEGEEPQPRLGSPTEEALVRITQEALTNVAKHARASQITVSLREDNNTVRLEVRDDGVGMDLEETEADVDDSWGLITMRERAEALGGHCRVHSEPGKGTRVIVEIER